MEMGTRFDQGKQKISFSQRARRGWSLLALSALLLITLAACGSPATSSQALQTQATSTNAPTGIGPLASPSPVASQPPNSPAPIAAPLSFTPSVVPSPIPSIAPSVAPSSAPSALPSAAPSAAPSAPASASAAPSPKPSAPPSAVPASAAPSAVPSAAPSLPPGSIPATGQACPDSHPWRAYTGPEGDKWYRSPESVAIYNRQPPAICFASEGAAQAAGYAPDPRPARTNTSTDGTCPKDNPVKGFTNASGQQVYLAPGDPNYATQKATHCFSDTGIAEYFTFLPATAFPSPSASAKPSASPSTGPKPNPSAMPSGGAMTLSPQIVDLGTVSTATTPATRTVTLTYTGPDYVFLKSLTPQILGPNAAEFAIKLDKCTGSDLANGGTCTFVVTFQPKGGPGERTATLTILINDTIVSTSATLKGIAK